MIQNEIDNIDETIKKDGFNKLLSALEEEKYEIKSSLYVQNSENHSLEKINFV